MSEPDSPLPAMAPSGGESNARYGVRIAFMVILLGAPLAGLLAYLGMAMDPCEPLLRPIERLNEAVERGRSGRFAARFAGVDYDGEALAGAARSCCARREQGEISESDWLACGALAERASNAAREFEEAIAASDPERAARAAAELAARGRVLMARLDRESLPEVAAPRPAADDPALPE